MTQKNGASKVVTQAPKKVSIANIEPELGHLWAQFNQANSDGHAVVMRACMSNLIIFCDSPQEAEIINQEIAAIVDVHPARILLLLGNGKPSESTMEANVAIYYTALDDGWQVCAERIDIVSTSAMAERLPSVARSLLVGDLPTTLWWASQRPPPTAGETFFQLAELANQIIYDNVGWVNPAQGVAAMTRWVAAQQNIQIVHNLAWRRFAGWRKLISQVLDPQTEPDALESLHTIEIAHGPHALPMTWLLTGWLASQLNWQPIDGKRLSDSELVWRFRNNNQDIKVHVTRLPKGNPLIYQLLFDWGKPALAGRICFKRLDNERIGISEELSTVPPRVFTVQVPERSTLVSAQLAQRNRDKIFENALKSSNAMTAVFQQ
ncbi:glucose-6-phosphate dehydrogenase subunit [Methyloglobulus morosus KoM1]|uniref:Glucose-6-phosphate dehydrogenase subunit n=1 Tax=Methyloglobulus morosus KoM1 TaxID=1116472 RepID=V5BKH4_9GAMM|nr:glucose-6-phosphate dehydrogenase assembly protein OpcA [Methyloglobulus morosus]ESS68279.1 glucose-6-phosphate dehydrogenase subunit [Methyloglobulus morosus KoM1]